ncbi:hypothetical protein EDEG_02831 [Edhazardia aedis USNM 41457]|uniref:Protein argonaute N-terminal domain-containing protein n=1 Tax=Edhazardia aedis (strain USNM 41457) TaxID=1003232 RepID=J9DJI3_EDHAE|nr:hypothetical protein EDEG_02831 [Edhazardia aedis USNM 41457]|eukprot:EJW02775.1 hypothetical protein EDEG_02831 [Edhazardia aedis USNM 41457]
MLENFPAPRPMFTTANVPLTCNFLRVNIPRKSLYHYLVTFEPEPKRTSVFPLFQRIVTENPLGNIAFDGINMLVSDTKFEDKKIVQKLARGTVECSIVYKNTYDMTEVSQFLDAYANTNQNVSAPSVDFGTHIQVLETIF